MVTKFNNLHSLSKYFNTELKCIKHLEKMVWNHEPACVHCGSTKVYRLKGDINLRCGEKGCLKIFNVKHNTIFMDTKIPLTKWFQALYLATSHKKGISSIQLGKDLGITQKSAWFMLGRIRELFLEKAPLLLDGEIEADEAFIGGSISNMHERRKNKLREGKGDNKTKVIGLLDRDGKVTTHVPLKSESMEDIREKVKGIVKEGSTIYTDEAGIYNKLAPKYSIQSVNHSIGEYVRGNVHTNGIEGFWSQLKRGIVGIYHQVSSKHLHRYCNEFSFRYNTRKVTEAERFDFALGLIENTKLTYPVLIESVEDKKGDRRMNKQTLKSVMRQNRNNNTSGNLI
ncbi:MAG: IS1595 family transposase [Bacteroidia bacterium]|nr:IS1595 family transposase [Bacteroidia bacterium]